MKGNGRDDERQCILCTMAALALVIALVVRQYSTMRNVPLYHYVSRALLPTLIRDCSYSYRY